MTSKSTGWARGEDSRPSWWPSGGCRRPWWTSRAFTRAELPAACRGARSAAAGRRDCGPNHPEAASRSRSWASVAMRRPRVSSRRGSWECRTILQEQNSIPGWTNRFLAPWADLVCCGFEDASGPSPRCLRSGPAIRCGGLLRIPGGRTGIRRRLLVLGGSQGSLFLNRTLPQALAMLRDAGIDVEIRASGRRSVGGGRADRLPGPQDRGHRDGVSG